MFSSLGPVSLLISRLVGKGMPHVLGLKQKPVCQRVGLF